MTKTNTKRWILVNKKTTKLGRSFATRAAARSVKSPNQAIYDAVTGSFVR